MRARKQRKIADEAQSRAASVRWLNGTGPMPDHLTLNFPEDEEKLERFQVGPIRSDDPKAENDSLWAVYQIVAFDNDRLKLKTAQLQATVNNRLTSANRKRITRKRAWQDFAKQKAEEVLRDSGIHRQSARQLSRKLCGIGEWDPEARFTYSFKNGPKTLTLKISADALSRYLNTLYSFPYST